MVLTPDPIVVTTTIVAPTVVNPTSLTPVAVSAITSVVAPTIVLSASTLTPAAVTVVTTVEEPEVKTGEIVIPSAVTATIVVVAPIVRKGGVTLTPDAVVSNAVVITPTTLNPTIFTPAAVQAITAVLPPSVASSGTVTISAPVVVVTSLVVIPTMVADDTTFTPDVVTSVATVVTPTVSLSLIRTPPVVTVATTVLPPSLTIGSVVYSIHPRGRRQIAVDQLQGGEKYPFVAPTDDLDQLIGDLYLNYADADCSAALPFSIKWLEGFGTEDVVNPVGAVHTYDMEIVDADGNTVFDSRDADVFKTTPWGDNSGDFAVVAEWVNTETGAILRAVIYTAWISAEDARDWPVYFEPDNGVIDPRTLERLPPYVSQLAIINDLTDESEDDNIDSGENVVLDGGYNSTVAHLTEAESTVDGGAYVRVIQIDLEPGTGLGRFPCDPEVVIKQINGVSPNELGNIIVDASGCWRAERPLENVDDHEADVVLATLQLLNSCGPCCDCASFVKVYKAIKNLDKRYRDFGIRAEAIRDQYLANKNRWSDSQSCRTEGGVSIQIAAEAFPGCKVAIGVAVCNNTDSPLQNVTLDVDFDYGPGDDNYIEPPPWTGPPEDEPPPVTASNSLVGCILCNSTARKGNVPPGGGSSKGSKPYKIGGAWPNYKIGFDCINPGDQGVVTWVMKFDGCSNSDVVEFVVIHDGKVYKKSVSLVSEADDDCCEDGGNSSSASSESSEEP